VTPPPPPCRLCTSSSSSLFPLCSVSKNNSALFQRTTLASDQFPQNNRALSPLLFPGGYCPAGSSAVTSCPAGAMRIFHFSLRDCVCFLSLSFVVLLSCCLVVLLSCVSLYTIGCCYDSFFGFGLSCRFGLGSG
jgi:hypothetical protein